MNKSESIKALSDALCKAQAEMPAAKFDASNPFLKNKYASLGAIIEAARPVLAKHGLSFSQLPVNEGEQIGVTSILMHSSGEWIESTLTLPVTDEKGKSTAQVAGSVITYLRRYALASMLGIYADEDTDGNGTGNKKPDLPAIEYPPELAVVTNSKGVPYVDIDTETLSYMENSIRKELRKPDLSDDKQAELAMKADVIKDIFDLRNAG